MPMSGPAPIAPFELDPKHLDPARIELIEPEPAPAPLVPLEEPPPPRARPWRRLLFGGGALLLAGMLGVEAYDFVVGLFERSVWLTSSPTSPSVPTTGWCRTRATSTASSTP
jgi:hypothetical protein